MPPLPPVAPTLVLALALALAACDGDAPPASDAAVSPQDSIATAREVRSSLAGVSAPGGQTYTYRGLYAGMTRAMLEGQLPRGTAPRCTPAAKPAGELSCAYDATLGPDGASVAVTAAYTADPTPRAREIVAVRQLPIAVDGVLVAKELADAFEAQTRLLDRRDATYGRHQATVRVGTTSGARLNAATVVVQPRQGREELTVTLSRTGAPPPSPAPAPAPVVKAKPKPTTKAVTKATTTKATAPRAAAPRPATSKPATPHVRRPPAAVPSPDSTL